MSNQLNLKDMILLHTILTLEEKIPNILSSYPHLQEYRVKMSNVPTIRIFLESDRKKKPPPNEIFMRTVYIVLIPGQGLIDSITSLCHETAHMSVNENLPLEIAVSTIVS